MTLKSDCDCRSDWVMCFRVGCPRALALGLSYRQQIERTLELIGDPRTSATPEVPK
jgi:hypothetical protein